MLRGKGTRMIIPGQYFVLLLICTSSTFGEKKERMLLHSDADMAAEILRQRAELANTTSQLGSVLSELNTLKQKIHSMEAAQQNVRSQISGSVYIRWGKKTCPNSTDMVYHGYSGGKRYDDRGSGSDNLCLPSDPTWGIYVDGYQKWRGAMYGTETDIPESFFPGNTNQDMPCAVCRSSRSTTMMIPARKDCYAGWSLEYTGYLVGPSASLFYSYNHACLDSHPDFLDHGSNNDDDHDFHLVEGHCGSLPCPPYVDGRELTCVVCSI